MEQFFERYTSFPLHKWALLTYLCKFLWIHVCSWPILKRLKSFLVRCILRIEDFFSVDTISSGLAIGKIFWMTGHLIGQSLKCRGDLRVFPTLRKASRVIIEVYLSFAFHGLVSESWTCSRSTGSGCQEQLDDSLPVRAIHLTNKLCFANCVLIQCYAHLQLCKGLKSYHEM